MDIPSKLAKRLGALLIYRGPASLLLAAYSWLLRRFPKLPLPLRGRVFKLRLRGLDRPVAVRLGTSDADVVEEIFGGGEYGWAIQSPLPAPGLILDLGANIGASVRLWQKHFPGAKIVAVEPDADNLAMCRLNAELGGRAADVVHVRACAAGRARAVVLDRGKGAWGITMREPGADPAGEEVPALSVPEILALAGVEGGVDLLKCDIEGAEREVFAECGDWLPAVGRLAVELHEPYLRDSFLADLERSGAAFEVKNFAPGKTFQVIYLERRGAPCA